MGEGDYPQKKFTSLSHKAFFLHRNKKDKDELKFHLSLIS